MEPDYCLTPYKSGNSEWITDLIVSHETIKFFKENIGKTFLDINTSNFFMNMSPQARGTKSKNEQVGLYQAEIFCTAKDTIIRIGRYPKVWENIFKHDRSNNRLTSKIHKELTHVNKKKRIIQLKNEQSS